MGWSLPGVPGGGGTPWEDTGWKMLEINGGVWRSNVRGAALSMSTLSMEVLRKMEVVKCEVYVECGIVVLNCEVAGKVTKCRLDDQQQGAHVAHMSHGSDGACYQAGKCCWGHQGYGGVFYRTGQCSSQQGHTPEVDPGWVQPVEQPFWNKWPVFLLCWNCDKCLKMSSERTAVSYMWELSCARLTINHNRSVLIRQIAACKGNLTTYKLAMEVEMRIFNAFAPTSNTQPLFDSIEDYIWRADDKIMFLSTIYDHVVDRTPPNFANDREKEEEAQFINGKSRGMEQVDRRQEERVVRNVKGHG